MEGIDLKPVENGRFEYPRKIWVESNLERYPFFVYRRGEDHGNVIFYREIRELEDGRKEECDWEVAGHSILGLPKAFDQDLYVGVLRMLDEVGGPDHEGKLWFKIYNLLEFAGLKRDGRNYERAKESIQRIGTASIRARNTFYSPRLGRRRRQQEFKVWDSDLIDHEGRRGSNLESNWIRFHDIFLESYKEGYVDRLDSEFYRSLSKSLTKRWFRLLNEHCDGEGFWRVGMYQLRDLVPLAKSVNRPGDILRIVRSVGGELQERGYLQDFGVVGRMDKTEVLYKLAPHFGRRRLADRVALDPVGKYAIGLMSSYRMSREDAAELIIEYGSERCIEVCEQLPNQKKEIRSPVGWIKRGLEEEYVFPSTSSKKPASGGQGSGTGSKEKPRSFREGYEWFFDGDQNPDEDEDSTQAGRVGGTGVANADDALQETPRLLAAKSWSRLLDKVSASGDRRFSEVYPYILVSDHLMLACDDEEVCNALIDEYGELLGKLWREERGDEEALINIGSEAQCDQVFEHLYASTQELE